MAEIKTLVSADRYMRELRRPWKLFSFALGMAWLFYGALTYQFADWDLGVSALMGGLTYLCAPWTVLTIGVCLRQQPRHWPWWIALALVLAWAVIDGSYTAYNTWMGHAMDRSANFPASAALYFLAGVLWSYQRSLGQLIQDLRPSYGGP
jgi:hypothetical protein